MHLEHDIPSALKKKKLLACEYSSLKDRPTGPNGCLPGKKSFGLIKWHFTFVFF